MVSLVHVWSFAVAAWQHIRVKGGYVCARITLLIVRQARPDLLLDGPLTFAARRAPVACLRYMGLVTLGWGGLVVTAFRTVNYI